MGKSAIGAWRSIREANRSGWFVAKVTCFFSEFVFLFASSFCILERSVGVFLISFLDIPYFLFLISYFIGRTSHGYVFVLALLPPFTQNHLS